MKLTKNIIAIVFFATVLFTACNQNNTAVKKTLLTAYTVIEEIGSKTSVNIGN